VTDAGNLQAFFRTVSQAKNRGRPEFNAETAGAASRNQNREIAAKNAKNTKILTTDGHGLTRKKAGK